MFLMLMSWVKDLFNSSVSGLLELGCCGRGDN